eukprot:scaffold35268_cov36-Cyclotella_meneghiniana.AAC.3
MGTHDVEPMADPEASDEDIEFFCSPSASKKHNNILKTNQAGMMTISPYPERGHPHSKTMSKNNKNPSETPTTATQVSRALNADFLGNARSKLKSYLGGFRPTKHADNSSLKSEAGGTYLSGTKPPKQRRYSSSSKSTDALTKHSKTSQHQIASDLSSVIGSEDEEGKSYIDSVKTKYYDQAASDSSKKSKKKLTKKNSTRKKLSKKIDQPKNVIQEINMFDLPSSDNRLNSRLQGQYSGPVDAKPLPHGKGTLILEGNETPKFYDVFEHSNFASSLVYTSEDETIFSVSEICRFSNVPAPMNTRSRGQEPSGVLLYDETHLYRRHSQQDMLEKQRRPIKMPTAARRLSTGTYSQDIEHHFALSATNTVSTSNYEMTENQHHCQVEMPTATTRATIETAQYPTNIEQSHKRNDVQSNSLSRPPYNLGDIARTPKHMITQESDVEAIHSASLLKVNELAFLKRSNGLWTTAILADRSLQPTKTMQRRSANWYSEWEIASFKEVEDTEFEETFLFVINEEGAKKIVQRRHWGKYVRRMIDFERVEVQEDLGRSNNDFRWDPEYLEELFDDDLCAESIGVEAV